MKRIARVAGILLLLALAMAFKGELVRVPEVGAAQAGEFDTGRALQRLRRVLGDERPHPVDSPEGDAVRGRLVAELRVLGLTPTVTDEMACNGSGRTIACARVRNVLATIGRREGRHVLLVSHYDSTPVGPGAADDGIGVAVMLETAALLRDRPLQRPVTFLFNEGEESGLIGARAFVERNPLAGRVESVVNLESRGTSGPAIMFETSRPNGRAVGHYARSVERPAANSLTTDFYGLIPNSTDVTVFKERPWTILNFAIIGNETRYHSPGDTLAALDPRSVGHMGQQALAVTADLASGEPAGSGERLYADILGLTLVTLPIWLGIGLLGALLLGFIWLAWSRRGGIARGAGAVLLALADAALTVFVLQALIGWMRPGEFWRAHPELISLPIDVTAIASSGAALLWLALPIARDRLRIAFWLIFLVLGAGISLVAPRAAIFFLLPPLLAGAGLLVPRFARAASLFAVAALLLSWVPLFHLSQVLLDFDAGWTFAPVAVLILFPLLIELKPQMAKIGRGRVTAALAAAALLAWAPAALAPAYSADRKQRLSIEYVWDAQARKAQWMAYHDRASLPAGFDAVGEFRRDVEVPWSSYKRWAADARGPAVEPPVLERVAERSRGNGRIVTFRLRSRGADHLRLRAAQTAGFQAVRVDNAARRFGGGEGDYVFRCHGRSCDGLQFELQLGSWRPVELTVMGIRPALPAEAQPLVAARPPLAQPQYSPDATIAVARVRL